MHLRFHILCIVLLVCSYSTAQVTFEKSYDISAQDEAVSVVSCADGGFFLGGESSPAPGDYDCYIIKTDRFGNILWTKTIGVPGIPGESGIYSVKATSDSGCAFVGRIDSSAYLVRLNKYGDTLWTRTFGNPYKAQIFTLDITDDNGFLFAGNIFPTALSFTDIFIVRTDSMGNQLWSKSFGNPTGDMVGCIKSTPDGGSISVGHTQIPSIAHFDMIMLKTDSSGSIEWIKTYNRFNSSKAYVVEPTDDGGYCLLAEADSAYLYRIRLLKTDHSGNLIWAKQYPGARAITAGAGLQKTHDGGFVFTGATDSSDIFLVKTDSLGEVEWSRAYGTNNIERGYSIEVLDTGYAISGFIAYPGNLDFYLVRTDSLGFTNCQDKPFVVTAMLDPVTDSTVALTEQSIGIQGNHFSIVSSGGTMTDYCSKTGIELINKFEFNIYPVPARDFVSISMSENLSGAIIRVIDITGKILIDKNSNGQIHIELNTKNLVSGMYILRIESEGVFVNKKIIIQKY